MRPHTRKAKSKASGLARARLIIKSKLWWLTGFPDTNTWQVVPLKGDRRSENLGLDRSDLRKATYAVTKLSGEFPRALPEIVGDAPAWVVATRRVINELKPWIHHGTKPFANLFLLDAFYPAKTQKIAQKLLKDEPKLCDLVKAVSWVYATKQDKVHQHLNWIRDHAEPLKVILRHMPRRDALLLAIQTTELGVSLGAKTVSPMVLIAGSAELYVYPVCGGGQFISHAINTLNSMKTIARKYPESALSPGLPKQLNTTVEWLIAQDDKTRRRFLSLFCQLELACIVEQWATWWPTVLVCVEKARNLQQSYDDRDKVDSRLKKIRHELEAARASIPPALDVTTALGAARALAESDHATLAKAVCSALDLLHAQGNPTLKASLLVHWWHLDTAYWRSSEKDIIALVQAFKKYVADSSSLDLSPWLATVVRQGESGKYLYTIDDDILDSDSRLDIARIFEAFSRFRQAHPKPSLNEIDERIVELVQVSSDARTSPEFAWQMLKTKQHKQWRSESILRAALKAGSENRALYSEFLLTFTKLEEQSELNAEQIYDPLCRLFSDHMPLLHLLLTSKEFKRLQNCARKLALLEAFKKPLFLEKSEKVGTQDWFLRFPPAVHENLLILSRVSQDAEQITTRAAKGIVPDFESLARELDTIRSLIEQSRGKQKENLIRRSESIHNRLQNTGTLSEVKLVRFKEKLDRAASRALLQRIDLQANTALQGAMANLLEVPKVPEWIMANKNLSLLLPVLDLPARQRKLAVQLLRTRCAGQPWDLRDEPANMAFLDKLEKRGIDCAPWLNGLGTIRHQTKRGVVVLALEDDPLEIFRMGAYFQTCLSPGQFNYFSVFSNAADINKRVLYARADSGRVVGRRLICLTDKGHLLVFHAYSHDSDYEFDRCSEQFAKQLATAMGTNITANESVSRLVAVDWYDDGPVDIAHQFSFLKEGSAFRSMLENIEPKNLISKVRSECTDIPLEEIIVPLLLRLPEFDRRPQLAVALISNLDTDALPAECSLRAGLLLESGGAVNLAGRFTERVAKQVLSTYRNHQWTDFSALSFIARHHPSLALRVIRDTRERRIRSWAAETSTERLVAAAIAFVRLRRTKQAKSVLELAIMADGPKDFKKRALVFKRKLDENEQTSYWESIF